MKLYTKPHRGTSPASRQFPETITVRSSTRGGTSTAYYAVESGSARSPSRSRVRLGEKGGAVKAFNQTPLDWRALYRLGIKTCPICQRRDNCSGARDESGEVGFIYCRRPSENRTGLAGKPGRDGGATFVLNPRTSFQPATPRPVITRKPEAFRADADHCDGVYSTLVRSLLTLRDGHRAKLIGRGLSDEEIDRTGLRSAPRPEECAVIGDALAKYDLRGVPGFYHERGRWLLRDLGSGVLIPVRDARSRIRALQLRRDDGALRYVWLSTPSDKFVDGASSGAPIHFARHQRIRETGEALITEGALKGMIISHFLGAGVIAVGGTSAFSDGFGAMLKAELPELRRVTICYDADWTAKREVKKALLRLQRNLSRAGLRWKVRTWPGEAKGYDDYLLSVAAQHEEVAA
ncbi:MAG: DUF3854 domain-containing protein [Acidobacteria bacterium]|nr:DUF3854 domain-containing protein [Acidobacteriota bacterium]